MSFSILNPPTSVIHVCGNFSNGELRTCDTLLGKKIMNVKGNREKLYALSETGAIDLISANHLKETRFTSMAFGSEHNVGAANNGTLYSWGSGEFGELGQGSKIHNLPAPTEIRSLPPSTRVVDVSCGEFHSCILDDKGNLYSWGQNFNSQLGLFKKKQSEMVVFEHCCVEEISPFPKFNPFSIDHRVIKVSCGARFTAVVTKNGEIWTWGAGECGQLGIGRCTQNSIPSCAHHVNEKDETSANITRKSLVYKPKKKSDKIVIDIACGYAHAIAVTQDGKVLVWGMNKHYQLGLGESDTKFEPVELGSQFFQNAIARYQDEYADAKDYVILSNIPNDTVQYNIVSVYADLQSTAAIDSMGRLYTWGSSANYRTMHDHVDVIKTPALVHRLAKNQVQRFAFSRQGSAALVCSKLVDVFPKHGPQKSFRSLTLIGCGFYKSDDIVVKFTKLGTTFVPPRSSVGKFVKDGEITCKPPRFAEPGHYAVTVSLNGEDFVPENVSIEIFAEPAILAMQPLLFDTRSILQDTSNPNNMLNIKLVGANIQPGHRDDVLVKLSVTTMDPDGDYIGSNPNTMLSEEATVDIIVVGTIVAMEMDDFDEKDSFHDDEGSGSNFHDDEEGSPVAVVIEEKLIEQHVTCSVSLEQIIGRPLRPNESLAGRMWAIRPSISLNDVDYCAPLPDYIFVHSFDLNAFSPCCLSIESPIPTAITCSGSSFLPSAFAPFEAVLSVGRVMKSDGEYGELPDALQHFEKIIPTDCIVTKSTDITVPRVKDIIAEAYMLSGKHPTGGMSVSSNSSAGVSTRRMSTSSLGNSSSTKISNHAFVEGSKYLDGLSGMELCITFRIISPPSFDALRTIHISDDEKILGSTRTLVLYKNAPIASFPPSFRSKPPSVFEIDGVLEKPVSVGKFYLSSKLFCFPMNNIKIQLEHAATNVKELVDAQLIGKDTLNENLQRGFETTVVPYVLECCYPFKPFEEIPLPFDISIGVVVDGATAADIALLQVKIPAFDRILISSCEVVPSAEGGNTVNLIVNNLLSENCLVKITGNNPVNGIIVSASLNELKKVSFRMPVGMLEPEFEPVKGAANKSFFVSISVDGGHSWDRSDAPILVIK